ncbi:MAG TPA: hypothetical protein VK590_05010, partial [Saprospiraceae bacterium]|nr:hypothetical protein [Saprospiraceae bacterium]
MSEIDFDELDYTKMMCNVRSIAIKKSPETEFDIFKKYKEFLVETPEIDRKKLFRYFPLVYDKNSPLHQVIQDIKRLKGKAAELAGFKIQADGNFMGHVMELMECNNRTVNQMIIRYVILHKSAKYHEMVVLREALAKLSVNVVENPTDKDLKNFQVVGERVDNVQQELLSGDNNEHLQSDLFEYYFEDQLQLRPEDVARKIREGK